MASTGTEPRLHEWRIDPRQYARHEERRGRRFAYESLDGNTTALVVVDMIGFFVEESPYCRGIVANVATLAAVVRRSGGSVAWVLPAVAAVPTRWAVEFYGDRIAELYRGAGGSGTLAGRLWPEFAIGRDDMTVEKRGSSAFFPGQCPLPEQLAYRSVDTVIVTGTVTDVCCAATARDAAGLGYRVVMVGDANAGRDDASHNAALETIYRSFGDVRSAAEVVDLLTTTSTP
jgi:nicotinamidase-related amidase